MTEPIDRIVGEADISYKNKEFIKNLLTKKRLGGKIYELPSKRAKIF